MTAAPDVICRLLGHRFRFHEFDPITITHSLRCRRCGLTGWANEAVDQAYAKAQR